MPDVSAGTFLEPLLLVLFCTMIFVPVEHIAGESKPLRRVDLGFATLGQVVTVALFVCVVLPVLSFVPTVAHIRSLTTPMPAWLATCVEIGVGLVIFDLAGYAYHRLAHRVPALWALHRVHHSSEELSWISALRQHPIENALLMALQNVPLFMLDIPLASHAGVLIFLRLHSLFVHSTVAPSHSMLLSLPAFHLHHHERDEAPANFASLFPWIDRAFGTYTPPTLKHDFGLARTSASS